MKHEKKNGEGCSQTRAILYRAHHKCLRASQQIQGSRRKREKRVDQRELKPGLKSYTKETRRPPKENQCMEKRSQKQ
jgi:hypothetical protein